MKIFTILKNIIAAIKNTAAQSDANLQTAKAYADTKQEYQDFASEIIINSSYYQIASGSSELARRVGSVCFLEYRLSTKVNITDGMNIKVMTLPFAAQYMLQGMVYYGNANQTRPLIFVQGDEVYLRWSTNIPSGTLVEFTLIFVANQ